MQLNTTDKQLFIQFTAMKVHEILETPLIVLNDDENV